MARQLLNFPTEIAGGIINITRYKDSTRRQLNVRSGASGRGELVNNFTFTKQKDNEDSFMLVTGVMGALGMPNYPHIGMCCTIDQIGYGQNTTSNLAPNHPVGMAGGGIYYCGVDTGNNNERTTFIIQKSFKEFILNAGSHRLDIGWNANSGVRPAVWLNPNSTNQSRHHQTASHILIYEIAR